MAKRKIRSISIPPELSAKMDRFPEENWSSIACRAFEIRYRQLLVMTNTDVRSRGVARLRASKLKSTDSLYSAGEVAGATYVLGRAEFQEMERLCTWNDKANSYGGEGMGQIAFYDLAKVLAGDDGTERDIAEEMKENYGVDIDQRSWLEGFIKGALGKFDELKAELD
jgi:hypothetical protein